jgi:hypothetical protein
MKKPNKALRKAAEKYKTIQQYEEDLIQAIKMARETEYPIAKGMDEIIEIIKRNGETK